MNHEVDLYEVLQLQEAQMSDVSGRTSAAALNMGSLCWSPPRTSLPQEEILSCVVFVFSNPPLFQALPVALSLALGIALWWAELPVWLLDWKGGKLQLPWRLSTLSILSLEWQCSWVSPSSSCPSSLSTRGWRLLSSSLGSLLPMSLKGCLQRLRWVKLEKR